MESRGGEKLQIIKAAKGLQCICIILLKYRKIGSDEKISSSSLKSFLLILRYDFYRQLRKHWHYYLLSENPDDYVQLMIPKALKLLNPSSFRYIKVSPPICYLLPSLHMSQDHHYLDTYYTETPVKVQQRSRELIALHGVCLEDIQTFSESFEMLKLLTTTPENFGSISGNPKMI
ncbi:hypothetical protein C0J52_11036 [Blattella germanica]|nr:hypothetical protein C0J52_11036 [Blattella germanica]